MIGLGLSLFSPGYIPSSVGGGPAPSLPLDDFGAASAAYSLRKLSSTYSGSSIRVRRTVAPFDEQDIGFTSGGDLDAAAIASFGGSDSLTVSVWYDQSGSSNDASQVTAANQPQIYDGAAVITDNGKPAVEFDGLTSYLINNDTISGVSDYTIYFVENRLNNIGYSLDSDTGRLVLGNNQGAFFNINNWRGTGLTQGAQYLNGYYLLNAGAFIAENGTVTQTGLTYFPVAISVQTAIYVNSQNLSSRFATGKVQEILIWNNDQSGNRTGIETNINLYYGIYTMYNYEPATSGLLADYPDAAAAYSVRQLNNNATVSMRVRRTVAPFDEQDIGFTAGGDLDEAAIVAFGGSDSLTVSVWYDQSGQQNHAEQPTTTLQPQIYTGAALRTINSKPAIYCDAFGPLLYYTTYSQPYSYSAVGEAGNYDRMLGNNQQWYQEAANTKMLGVDVDGGNDFRGIQVNVFGIGNGSSSSGKVAGSTAQPAAVTFSSTANFVFSAIGGRYTTSGSNSGEIQELIFWTNDQSTNRTAIETNINDYFSIYP